MKNEKTYIRNSLNKTMQDSNNLEFGDPCANSGRNADPQTGSVVPSI